MESLTNSVFRYFHDESFAQALAKVSADLKTDLTQIEYWRSLHFLLRNSNENVDINSIELFRLCLECIEKPDISDANIGLIAEILVLILEHDKCSEKLQPEIENFLKRIKSTIIQQMKSTHQVDLSSQGNSNSLSIIFSRVLPSVLKADLLSDTKSIEEVIISMILSKNEKAIVEGLVYIFPSLAKNLSSFELIFTNIKQLFEDENENYFTCNHPGLTALCSIADTLFSLNPALIINNEEWFCQTVQNEISNSVALNRKRSQYLLKRYADFFPEKSSIFNDFFLIAETLEEKQAHIITPVLTKVKGLEHRILEKKEANPSWVRCIYARILSHENLQIVKWGLQNLFEMKIEYWSGLGASIWLHRVMLTGLNNVAFYTREKNNELPPFAKQLMEFVAKCSKLTDECSGFFSELLRAMTKISWNSVGLFHLSYSLASISPRERFLDGLIMQTCLEFLRGGLHTQYPIIRGAIAGLLMEFVLNVSIVSQENLMWITLMLSTLNQKECFIPGSHVRKTLKTWFSDNFTSSQLNDYLAEILKLHFESRNDSKPVSAYSFDVTSLARYIVLLEDSGLFEEGSVQIVQEVLLHLENCHTRLYADPNALKKRIKLLTEIVNESKCSSGIPHTIVRTVGPFVESSIIFCLDQIASSTDFTSINEYLIMIESIVMVPRLGALSPGFARQIVNITSNYFEIPQALPKLKSLSLFLIADKLDENIANELACEIVKRKLHCQTLERDDSTLTNVTWGTLMSDYFAKLWRLIHRKLHRILPLLKTEEFTEEAVFAMDMVGIEAVKIIFSCLEQLLATVVHTSPSLCRSALKACWNTCFEYRRSEHFWPLMEAFSLTAFQSDLIESQELRPQIFEYLTEMKKQGENTLMLFNLAAERIINQWTYNFPSVNELSVQFLVDVLTFGQIHRRDEMILYETCTYVHSSKERFSINPEIKNEDMADGQVRFQGLRFLLAMERDNEHHLNMASNLLDALLSQDRALLKQKKRYFASSTGHRFKHRLWLAVIILQDFLPADHPNQTVIVNQALTGLVDDNPQPSVRFLLEWTVMRAIYREPTLEALFWKVMDDAVAQRVGSMVSFLSIVGHATACLAGNERLENFASNALPRALPWAMAQHFTPRLYGSVVIGMIWRVCEKAGLNKLLEQYKLVRHMQNRAPEMPNAQRNLEKLSQDFYMSLFHPLEHFTLETLCYHLPRLSHLINEEWIPVNWFDGIKSFIPHRNRDSKMADCQPADWVTRAAGGAPASVQEETSEVFTTVDNVQKKITPWKQMFPDMETLTLTAGRKKSSTNDLIVIASLVDRIPNLGGLCRTCEVLGVKDFVISSLRITEEKDFVSLSVSAERWMNMIEVKSHQLLEYIRELKLGGYTVIGAEQTAGSQPLNRFTFPKKTALLLGHEKEGIPVEFIQHLDVCVEVPQEGIIRSMNVHVTGAVFIWEYVRQQIDM